MSSTTNFPQCSASLKNGNFEAYTVETLLNGIQAGAVTNLQASLTNCFTCLETTFQAQADYIDKSEQKIAELKAERSQLQNRINKLIDSMTSAPSTSTRPRPLLPDPERFSGKGKTYTERQQSFRSFSAAIRQKMLVDGHCFETDDARIYYVASRVTDDAYRRIDAWIKGNQQGRLPGSLYFDTWEDVLKTLEKYYDVSDRARAAEIKMQTLRQNNSRWLEFYSDFSQLLADLNWNNAAKTAQLRAKINDELADAIVSIRPKPKDEDQCCIETYCFNRFQHVSTVRVYETKLFSV